ncbi:Substrate-binding region of ABC-type glycine betaine transport system [Rippkaea orientalis PCC 8801]|uniref:Substrate-binding region of ABC-type glycine betaine transport system n=1 Tax=Rippkaea orientalis (strain PCC 8801 / RF-1) TaxID=41431 RepID=B7K326_RIPO1|nr:glycine betaine ABC transporter substrate-binding protein [Rippkaea orientalis]ACK67727.1 Substrate-binding region of ABC-type glycine betaine transport system [Rippkaea orientalis PCC 8801]
MNSFYDAQLLQEIIQRTVEHLILVSIAMGAAIAVGIPLGIIIAKQPKLADPILGVANAIQTIPSLAIFGFLITVPIIGGIGKIPAIVALILYALLPIIRNTYTGIKQVDKGVKEAAIALGMTNRQILLLIEIPLALGIILAGVRVSTVICVGITTIAAAIGAGGLGVFIFRGISMVNNQIILAGAIPSAIIALAADWGIGWLEKSLSQHKTNQQKSNKKSLIIFGILGLILFSLLGIFHQKIFLTNQASGIVIIGSKNFTEQVILGEVLAQSIEAKTNLKVDRKFNLGGTFICHQALQARKIDGYVEYTGTAFTAILEQKPINNPQTVYEKIKQVYHDQFNLEVMPSLGFENTYAILVRQKDAKQYQLKTISDASQYSPQWQAGFGHEFLSREDGYPGLAKTYNLNFATLPKTMELGLMYRALANQEIDLAAGNSTDGTIPILNLTILEDNKKYFPPYEAVPIFNQETFKDYPNLRSIIEQLAGKISAQEMQQLNYQVDGEKKSVNEVVHKFLIKKGLTS